MIDLGTLISIIISAIVLCFSIYSFFVLRKMRQAEYLFTRVKLRKEDAKLRLVIMRNRLNKWKIEKGQKVKKGSSLSIFYSETWKRELPKAWLAENLCNAFLSYPFDHTELWHLILQEDFFMQEQLSTYLSKIAYIS